MTSGTISLWLDATKASTLTTSSGKVSAWADRTTNTYSYTQSSSSSQPTWVLNAMNGLPGLLFSGGQYVSTPSYSTSFNSTNTIFFVISGFSGGGTIMYKGASPPTWGYSGSKKIWMGDGTTAELNPGLYPGFVGNSCDFSTSSVPASTSGTIVCMSTTSASTIKFYYNGTLVANDNHNLNLAIADPGTLMTIGGPNVMYNTSFNGYVHEIIHYNAPLSAADITSVSAYLTNKWLSAAAPAAPTATGTVGPFTAASAPRP